MECKEVKAVVSIGCCYNLLSEEGIDLAGSPSGFPISHGVKSLGFTLGKSSRDLACQVHAYIVFTFSLILFYFTKDLWKYRKVQLSFQSKLLYIIYIS